MVKCYIIMFYLFTAFRAGGIVGCNLQHTKGSLEMNFHNIEA